MPSRATASALGRITTVRKRPLALRPLLNTASNSARVLSRPQGSRRSPALAVRAATGLSRELAGAPTRRTGAYAPCCGAVSAPAGHSSCSSGRGIRGFGGGGAGWAETSVSSVHSILEVPAPGSGTLNTIGRDSAVSTPRRRARRLSGSWACARVASPGSFPQLWKKLWKIAAISHSFPVRGCEPTAHSKDETRAKVRP